MERFPWFPVGVSGLFWIASMSAAQAIPGEAVAEVEAWIQAHPTLRPSPSERLTVSRSDTPARRFTFTAKILPVAGALDSTTELANVIRTEQITLVDTVDGITPNRLEESLRVIYDAGVYGDYSRARVVYRYPEELGSGFGDGTRQGELREGDRFAYWIDLTTTPTGFSPSGMISIFLKEDLPALQNQLARF